MEVNMPRARISLGFRKPGKIDPESGNGNAILSCFVVFFIFILFILELSVSMHAVYNSRAQVLADGFANSIATCSYDRSTGTYNDAWVAEYYNELLSVSKLSLRTGVNFSVSTPIIDNSNKTLKVECTVTYPSVALTTGFDSVSRLTSHTKSAVVQIKDVNSGLYTTSEMVRESDDVVGFFSTTEPGKLVNTRDAYEQALSQLNVEDLSKYRFYDGTSSTGETQMEMYMNDMCKVLGFNSDWRSWGTCSVEDTKGNGTFTYNNKKIDVSDIEIVFTDGYAYYAILPDGSYFIPIKAGSAGTTKGFRVTNNSSLSENSTMYTVSNSELTNLHRSPERWWLPVLYQDFVDGDNFNYDYREVKTFEGW